MQQIKSFFKNFQTKKNKTTAMSLPYKLKGIHLHSVKHKGGSSWLYEGTDKQGRTVILKEYCPHNLIERKSRQISLINPEKDQAFYEIGLQRFFLEGRFLDILTSPRYPKILKAFQYHGTAYILLKKIKGFTLHQWFLKLNREKTYRIPEPIIIEFLFQLLSAVNHLHKYNLVHLDIHPSNIMIHKGSLVLLDFGSMQHALDSVEMQNEWRTFTEGYTAPELKQSRKISFSADYYSIGACLDYLGVKQGKGYSGNLVRFVRACLDSEPDLRPSSTNHPLVKVLFSHMVKSSEILTNT